MPMKFQIIVAACGLAILFSLPPLFKAFQLWDCVFFPHDYFCNR